MELVAQRESCVLTAQNEFYCFLFKKNATLLLMALEIFVVLDFYWQLIGKLFLNILDTLAEVFSAKTPQIYAF